MAHRPRATETSPRTKFVGYVAEFDDPDRLIHACEQVRHAGYRKTDAYTPFPVHGIDEALGIRRTRLPFFVLAVGILACGLGLGLQWYANATDDIWPFPGYKFRISGKPTWSVPANIPVTFEVIVLSSAFATFFGMWALNRLPRYSNPLFRVPGFKRATSDRFFVMVSADDPAFDATQTKQQLQRFGALNVERVEENLSDAELPKFMRPLALCLLCAAVLPPVAIYRARGMTNEAPRLHAVPDMDWQEKSKTQTVSPLLSASFGEGFLFADGRAMRPDPVGTVARGELDLDDAWHRGYEPGTAVPADAPANPDGTMPEPKWLEAFPEAFEVNEAALARGERQYGVYCAICHGVSGYGDGLVSRRGLELNAQGKAAWTQAKSLHDPAVVAQPVGRLFDTITRGRNSMGPYASQITVEDRWAIVLYLKALQATQEASSAETTSTETSMP